MNHKMQATFFSHLTPPGTAALAVLALYGPEAWTILRGLFQPSLPGEPRPGTFRLGRLGDELGRDEVVLTTRPGPVWPVLEIHCHGGQQVLLWLEDLLRGGGAVACSCSEFYRQLGLPSWQVDAQLALAQAPTLRTAAILLDQYHGAFQNALAQIAMHNHPGHGTEDSSDLIQALARSASLGRHLVEPWRIAIGGAVNVGKSSLVNALAGHTRSIVSPLPGTTRDLVTIRLALDGWPIELIDTAGWRGGTDDLESAGIARARAALEQADLVVWLLDGSSAPVFPAFPVRHMVTVISKIDLPAVWDIAAVPEGRRVSAKTGEGVTDLCQFLASRLVPDPPPPRAPVPYTPALCDLSEALSRCNSPREAAALVHYFLGDFTGQADRLHL